MHQWSYVSTDWMHLLSLHERLKAAVKIRDFSPQIYWVSTLTAATFTSYLNTWKSRLLYQWHAECHKLAAGYCSGRIIFAFEANLLPLLIPSESTEMRTRSQTYHGHKQLTVAFHLRFLMFDNHSSATFNISTQKAHTNSPSPTDFMNNLGYYEFSKILSRLWLFSSCLSRFKKKQAARNSKAHTKNERHAGVHSHCFFICFTTFPNAC